MTLNTLWFILIAVLYIGFFLLEGFDFGVGILLPFLGKNDAQRRMMINAIGPHWDGNEVWLLTAGGATFAAFPNWYATLFSGFYLPFFLLVIGLIVRGVAFEFRGKNDNSRWRSLWDGCIFTGSLVSALLLGVAFANIVQGVPIDANMQYAGGLFTLLNLYALLGGIAFVALFTLHGAIFLNMKTSGKFETKAHQMAQRLWIPTVVILILFLVASLSATDLLDQRGAVSLIIPLIGLIALLATGYFLRKKRGGLAFVMTCVTILFVGMTLFVILYPRVLISSLDPAWSLTIENAASSPYTLQVMSIIALIFVPIVLVYQGWSYWVFRKRVGTKPEELTY
jgi:cytochrome bd ubiquinol oxidase subunit II